MDRLKWLGVGEPINWWLIAALLMGAALLVYWWTLLRNGRPPGK